MCPDLTRYGDINESLCLARRSKLDMPVRSVNVRSAILSDLYSPCLALLIKQKFSFQPSGWPEWGPRDSVAAEAVSWTESNPLNGAVGSGYI